MTDPSPEMPTAPTGLLGGLAPWFGAKRTLAPEIVRELGPHGAYWEPFCGSCAVLFAKPPISFETVNDLHGDLVNLAMVLASDRWQDLCARAVRTLPAEDLYLTCRDRLRAPLEVPAGPAACGDEHVERAWAYLVVSWQAQRHGGHEDLQPALVGPLVGDRRPMGLGRRPSSMASA